jgi:hypothetical protein
MTESDTGCCRSGTTTVRAGGDEPGEQEHPQPADRNAQALQQARGRRPRVGSGEAQNRQHEQRREDQAADRRVNREHDPGNQYGRGQRGEPRQGEGSRTGPASGS